MSRALRLKNNDYINSDGIVHNRKTLYNILNNEYYKVEKNLTATGWYRIAKINDKQINLMLNINTGYYNDPPSSIFVSILTIYQNAKISQLNGIKFPNMNPAIDKIRVQFNSNDGSFYVDIHYTPNNLNGVYIQCESKNDLDYVEILDPALVSSEYTTVNEITIAY